MAPDETDGFAALQSAIGEVYTANLSVERASMVLAALDAGLLQRCLRPVPRATLMQESDAAPDVVTALLEALVVTGVLERVDDSLLVAELWRPFCGPDARTLLHDALLLGEARARLLRQALGGATWSTDPEDQLAIARGVTWNPATDLAVWQRRRSAQKVPELADALSRGGRYLELGCGVGGAMLALVRAFPGVSAVGVEIAPELAAVAARAASELGVAERVRIVTADAVDFADPDRFDVCFWSQFFFPTESRGGALAAALAALRPGAVLVAPAPDVSIPSAEPYDDDARDSATERVLWATWGVPARSPHELVAEVQSAGFVDVHLVDGGHVPTLVARAPG